MALTAALQTLQGMLENVNPRVVGRQGLEADVGILTPEAGPGGRRGPGVGSERNDCPAQAKRRPGWGWGGEVGGGGAVLASLPGLCLPSAFQGGQMGSPSGWELVFQSRLPERQGVGTLVVVLVVLPAFLLLCLVGSVI